MKSTFEEMHNSHEVMSEKVEKAAVKLTTMASDTAIDA